MSSGNTTLPETLHEPLVIPLIQPSQPGSAVERWLWDMLCRGLIDVSRHDETPHDDTPTPTPSGVDVSSCDIGDSSSTAYSTTDTASSEDTTYCSDSDSPDKTAGKGISITAGVNEGHSLSYTLGKRVALREPNTLDRNYPHTSQLFRILIKVINQPVANIPELKRLGAGKVLPVAHYLLELDNGSNATWFMGHNCRRMEISPGSTRTRITYTFHSWESGSGLGERALLYDHAYIRTTHLPDSERPTTDVVRYADGSAAAVLLPDKSLTMTIDCWNWVDESWEGLIWLEYKPAVAYGVTFEFCKRQGSGILALGPMSRQAVFGDTFDHKEIPAFMDVLASQLHPISGGGTILYFAVRPVPVYQETETGYRLNERNSQHWISLNGWPCELQPAWSRPILLAPEGNSKSWKVRLLSMTFERYDKDEERYKPLDDSDSGTLKFGDDGLLVCLDCGASVTLVPPALVRYIRTKVWPTDKNKEIDATYQDTPCDLKNPQVPYYVPNSGWMRVIYKFASGLGKVVEVTGPINHFFGQPNPVTYKHTKDKEGLIFVGDPDILRGDVDAIFGLNFFQSMFVALHKPSASEAPPFVTLAPQWDSQVVQFSPRRKEGSGV